MSFLWYPVDSSFLALIPAGGAGPSDVVDTESLTVGEAAVATLLPVAVESSTLTESTVVLAIATATDSASLSSEDAQVTQGAAEINATESAGVTDALTTLQAFLTPTESLALTEVSVTIAADVAVESATLTDAAVVLAIVTGVDSAMLSELATPTLITSGNVEDSEIVTLSESAVAFLASVAVESATVSDTMVHEGQLALVDVLTFSEAAIAFAPFVGQSSARPSLTPLLVLTTNAGAIAVTLDSSLITVDSTLTTLDGGYLGEQLQVLAVEALLDSVVAMDELVGASVGIS